MSKKALKVDKSLVLRPQTSAPADVEIGEVYFDSASSTHKIYTETGWINLGTPAGNVSAFAGSIPPPGWLVCNGAPISRTVYASLYATVGVTYGSGDGSTTFNLPDLRGIFIRGTGSQTFGAETYSGASLGGKQNDATSKNGLTASSTSSLSLYTGGSRVANTVAVVGNTSNYPTVAETATVSTTTTIGAGDAETRPANMSLNYIIKV